MHGDESAVSALGAYEDDTRFGDRLAALAAYREVGDRRRLIDARRVLERTGGIPADWYGPR